MNKRNSLRRLQEFSLEKIIGDMNENLKKVENDSKKSIHRFTENLNPFPQTLYAVNSSVYLPHCTTTKRMGTEEDVKAYLEDDHRKHPLALLSEGIVILSEQHRKLILTGTDLSFYHCENAILDLTMKNDIYPLPVIGRKIDCDWMYTTHGLKTLEVLKSIFFHHSK